MNVSALRKKLISPLINVPGWHTDRKLVVIESDDWGSIRMPSREVYDSLLKKGVAVDHCPYCRYDSLATEDDLSLLFDTLRAYRDANGSHPVITANCVVANPDFDRIRHNDFQDYYYKPFTETFRQYNGCAGSFALWIEGMENKVFHPEYHGREHLHVNRWMNALRANLPETMLAFDHCMFGISTTISAEKRPSYLAALEIDNPADEASANEALADGCACFTQLFGYPPQSFIAPNYIWFAEAEATLASQGIQFLQGVWLQHLSLHGGRRKKRLHYTGQHNDHGQVYTVRNCYFEPSLNPAIDWVSRCLGEISTAFRWKKPAILCSHRVNYIGAINPANRDNNLKLLKQLIQQTLNQWPDVEFMTSAQLGRCINRVS